MQIYNARVLKTPPISRRPARVSPGTFLATARLPFAAAAESSRPVPAEPGDPTRAIAAAGGYSGTELHHDIEPAGDTAEFEPEHGVWNPE